MIAYTCIKYHSNVQYVGNKETQIGSFGK